MGYSSLHDNSSLSRFYHAALDSVTISQGIRPTLESSMYYRFIIVCKPLLHLAIFLFQKHLFIYRFTITKQWYKCFMTAYEITNRTIIHQLVNREFIEE